MFNNPTNNHRLVTNSANHSVVYHEPIFYEPIYHAPIGPSSHSINRQVNFMRPDTPINNLTTKNTLHPNMFQPITNSNTSQTNTNQSPLISQQVESIPNQAGMQGTAPGYGNQVGMQGTALGYGNQVGMQGTAAGYGNQVGMQGTAAGYGNQVGMQGTAQVYGNQAGMQSPPQSYANQAGMQGTSQGYPNQAVYQVGNNLNQPNIQQGSINASYFNTNSSKLEQSNGTNPSVDPYFVNPLQNQLNVSHPMYNPYPKMKILPKQQSPSTSLLSSFKGPDGKYDVTTVVNTAGQMVNVVNQVGSIVKGIGGIFKV